MGSGLCWLSLGRLSRRLLELGEVFLLFVNLSLEPIDFLLQGA